MKWGVMAGVKVGQAAYVAVGTVGAGAAGIRTGLRCGRRRVLAAVPALLAQGLLRRPPSYQLPQGFYVIDSIFLVLPLMALSRTRSLEQLRYEAPGEWGKRLGLDRIPEVRTLREKVELLCSDPGRAKEWN